MKKIFVFLLFVLPLLSNAQDTQKAKNLLNEVTAKVKSYSTILIDFKYTLNNAKENINQESKGDVALKGNLFKLNIMGVTKLFDGVKNYTISPEDEEITISKHDDSDENAITPSKMLTFFNTGFKYSWDIQQNVKGRQIQFIKLIPTGAKDQRKEILLGIDVQTKHIYNLIEIGKNGTKTTLTITSFKVNQPLSKNNFIFEKAKYPNYYINNLN
jgi:outer membrane lipoprotein-sorting protein